MPKAPAGEMSRVIMFKLSDADGCQLRYVSMCPRKDVDFRKYPSRSLAAAAYGNYRLLNGISVEIAEQNTVDSVEILRVAGLAIANTDRVAKSFIRKVFGTDGWAIGEISEIHFPDGRSHGFPSSCVRNVSHGDIGRGFPRINYRLEGDGLRFAGKE